MTAHLHSGTTGGRPMTATRPHVGEDGVCDPDCPGCHYPGNGDDCPDWQSGDADRPCDVCSDGAR